MPETILVTGGAGFIGSHVVDRLLAAGYAVEVIDDLSTGHRDNLPATVRLHEADVASPAAAEIIGQVKPKSIVHLAAQIDVRRSLRDPKLDAHINVVGGLNVVKAALEAGVRHLAFASSAAVYGKIERPPVPESAERCPVDHYGVSKMAFEHYLRVFREVEGLSPAILRFANVYGPRQTVKGEAGVIAIFIKKLFSGEPPLIHGDGEQTRDYVFVADVAQAVVEVVRQQAGGTYNVSTGRETSVNGIAERLIELTDSQLAPEHGPGVPNENRRCSLSPERIKRDLGWSAQVSLSEGLARTVAAARQSPHFIPRH